MSTHIQRANERTSLPRTDVFESREELLLLVDLPGVTKNGLKVEFDKGHLRIEGHRARTEGEPVSAEFEEDKFARSFRVPQGIEADKISAELAAGVLRLRLPKAESQKPRQIAIQTN